MKKRVFVLFAAIIMTMLFSVSAFAAKPRLSRRTIQLTEGKTGRIYLKNVKKGTVRWVSSNKTIAAVKKNGRNKAIITAKKSGTATITARFNGKKYRCKITVKEAAAGPGKKEENPLADKKVSWSIAPSCINTVKDDEPFCIMLSVKIPSTDLKRTTHTFKIEVEDETVIASSLRSVTVVKTTECELFFRAKKVGSTTIIISYEGTSRRVHVNVTEDHSAMYLSDLDKQQDSNGNFIPGHYRRFDKEETCYTYAEAWLHPEFRDPAGEWEKSQYLPYDGYHIGYCTIALEHISGQSTLYLLPDTRIGACMDEIIDGGRGKQIRLRLMITDGTGEKKQINTLDPCCKVTLDTKDSHMYINNAGSSLNVCCSETTGFSWGALHIKYKGLAFDIPIGTSCS